MLAGVARDTLPERHPRCPAEVHAAGMCNYFTGTSSEILQMAADFRLRLRHFGVSRNPRRPVQSRDSRIFAHRDASPMVCNERMKNRTPYAVDVTGGGRSSAISRRMSANKVLGMATSAIWNAPGHVPFMAGRRGKAVLILLVEMIPQIRR